MHKTTNSKICIRSLRTSPFGCTLVPQGDLRSKNSQKQNVCRIYFRRGLFYAQNTKFKNLYQIHQDLPVWVYFSTSGQPWIKKFTGTKSSQSLILKRVYFMQKILNPKFSKDPQLMGWPQIKKLHNIKCSQNLIIRGLFYVKMPNSKSTHPFRHQYFRTYLKILNSAPQTFQPWSPKKVFHTLVGHKPREEIDFLETGCFGPGPYPGGRLI